MSSMFEHYGEYSTAKVYVAKDYDRYMSDESKKRGSDDCSARSGSNVTVK